MTQASRRNSLAVVVASGALLLSVSLGIRQTFGLFIGPIASDHLVTVGFLSFAIAVQNLMWGLAQPFAGALTIGSGPRPWWRAVRSCTARGCSRWCTGPTRSRSCSDSACSSASGRAR